MTMKQLINVMDLQLKLRSLRQEFQSARPLLPEETRDFTYEKANYAVGRGTTGFRSGEVLGWTTVTVPVRVRLRKFGIPAVEARIRELSKQIRETKQKIRDLGDTPEGWDRVNSNKPEENND